MVVSLANYAFKDAAFLLPAPAKFLRQPSRPIAPYRVPNLL
jgi:hypothetical protein